MRSRRLVFRGGRRWLGGKLWARRRRLLRAVDDVTEEDVCIREMSATRFEEDWGGFGERLAWTAKSKAWPWWLWMLHARRLVPKDAQGARTRTQQRLAERSISFDFECGPPATLSSRTRLLRKLCLETPTRRRLHRHRETLSHQGWHIECRLPYSLINKKARGRAIC